MSISRRQFLGTTAIGAVAGSNLIGAAKMPTRILGNTGAKVSILAFGCGSRFLMYDDEKALEALNRALDLGITYVDTAYGYGNGKSETRVGQLMGTRRNGIFLATKLNQRKADEALRTFEGSLKRLQTDHVDVVHIHGLGDEKDLADIEAPDGVLKAVRKLRDEKSARFIGITCHADPSVLKTALERHDFDVTQMALNAGLAGMVIPKGGGAFEMEQMLKNSFQSLALPVANRKKMGVIAMKVFAQEKLNGKAPVEKLIRYSLSLPITTAVVGMPKFEHIDENIAVAKNFQPLSKSEMRELSDSLSHQHKAAIDHFFMDHVDA